MIDKEIRAILNKKSYKNLNELYDDFPNIDKDKILYHVKKHLPELLNDRINDSEQLPQQEQDDHSADNDGDLNNDKKTTINKQVIQWYKSNPLKTLSDLYDKFSSSKEATLRNYKSAAVKEFIPGFIKYFLLQNIAVDWNIEENDLTKLIEYLVARPQARDATLRRKFDHIEAIELKKYQQRILKSMSDYALISNAENTNITDHASSLDLKQLEKKASEIQKTASNNSDKVTLNDENYSQLIQGINTLKEEIDVLKKENKSLKGLLINYAPNMKDVINDLINRVKKLEKTMHTIVITDDGVPPTE